MVYLLLTLSIVCLNSAILIIQLHCIWVNFRCYDILACIWALQLLPFSGHMKKLDVLSFFFVLLCKMFMSLFIPQAADVISWIFKWLTLILKPCSHVTCTVYVVLQPLVCTSRTDNIDGKYYTFPLRLFLWLNALEMYVMGLKCWVHL